MEEADVTIIGAGVVGLAIADTLSQSGRDVTVIEKNTTFGQETSSRNSEVIHGGLYYPKESLKFKTCLRGNRLLYSFTAKHGIPHKKLGKLIVASGREEVAKLNSLYKNASDCGVRGLKLLEEAEIKKIEPGIKAEWALLSPETGILDTHNFMQALFNASKKHDTDYAFSVKVIDIKKTHSFYEVVVREPKGDFFSFQSKFVVNSAGLNADKIAGFVGIDPEKNNYKIHYSKGDYFRIRNPHKFQIRHLIYPPPSERDLGIHITPDMAGGLRLGPDSEYVFEIGYDIDEKKKGKFLDSVSKFLPQIGPDDLTPDTAGIRPKLQAENEPFRDFVIKEETDKGFPRFINLIGIESPGLTSALAIAEIVKSIVDGV
jgi:L-2-hydroxyglutarate oxidase LhgO